MAYANEGVGHGNEAAGVHETRGEGVGKDRVYANSGQGMLIKTKLC